MRRLLVVPLFGALACHVADETRPPPIELPQAYTLQGGTADVHERWWREFGDPELSQLIEDVLAENLELRQAWARLEQAQALEKQARAGFFPSLRAEAAANNQRQNFNFGDDFEFPSAPGASFEFPTNSTVSGYPITIAASYEIDLWGKVRNGRAAARHDVQQRRDDVEVQATSLAAEVADTWFRLLEQRARREIMENQLGTIEDYAERVEYRIERGLSTMPALRRLEGQIAQQKRALATVVPEERVLENRLALLLGRAPGKPIHPHRRTFVELPPLPRVGPPTTLLAERPDVRAAFRRVVAADHRVGVAIADRYPALSLNASTGFQGRNNGLFSNWIYTRGANLTVPRFEGGRRKAEVERTQAVLEEAVAGYGQALLRALVEVEDALARVNAQGDVLEQLELEHDANRLGLERATADYLAGLDDYLAVLDSLRSLHSIELETVGATAREYGLRVQLYRALGSRWSDELQAPEPLTAQDRDPKKRRAKNRELRRNKQ